MLKTSISASTFETCLSASALFHFLIPFFGKHILLFLYMGKTLHICDVYVSHISSLNSKGSQAKRASEKMVEEFWRVHGGAGCMTWKQVKTSRRQENSRATSFILLPLIANEMNC